MTISKRPAAGVSEADDPAASGLRSLAGFAPDDVAIASIVPVVMAKARSFIGAGSRSTLLFEPRAHGPPSRRILPFRRSTGVLPTELVLVVAPQHHRFVVSLRGSLEQLLVSQHEAVSLD
jgi:hypothetical protein